MLESISRDVRCRGVPDVLPRATLARGCLSHGAGVGRP
jgi:hypothetical protein